VNKKTLALALLAAFLFAPAAKAADSLLVANFDDQTNKNATDGFWFYLDDKGSQGNSKVTSGDTTVNPVIFSSASFGEGANSILGYSGKLGYTFGTVRPSCGGTCTYSPEVTMGTNIVPTGLAIRDLTGATSLTFWAKAVPPVKVSIIALTKDVTDYSWARAEVSVTAEWKRYTAAFSGAAAPVFKGTYGQMKDKFPNLAQMESFNFALQKDSNPTVTSGYLLLDDLYVMGLKDPNAAVAPAMRPSLARALRAAADGKAIRVTVPAAYRNVAGTVAALDLSGRIVAKAAFAKGQESVSLDLRAQATATLFLRVFTGAEAL
jgi:hypothetical protein